MMKRIEFFTTELLFYLCLGTFFYIDYRSIYAVEKSRNLINHSSIVIDNRKPPQPDFARNALTKTNARPMINIFNNHTGITLYWQAVTTDTTGQPEELACYEILRDSNAYSGPDGAFLYAASLQPSFTDDSTEFVTGKTSHRFYKIRARDWWGNRSKPSNCAGVTYLQLKTGWNLIAMPMELVDYSLEAVLGARLIGASTAEQVPLLCAFDAEKQQFRVSWFNADHSRWYGDVNQLERGTGYFLKLPPGAPTLLNLIGYVPDTAISLRIKAGWNLIGNPLPTGVPLKKSGFIESGFAGGPDKDSSDQIFYLTDTGYRQAWYNISTRAWQGDFNHLDPGAGYWIYRHPQRGDFLWMCPIPAGE